MTDERILELRKCGYTLREIGNEFGVSYQAIQYRLKGIHERLEEERIRSEFEKVQKRNHPIYKIKKKYQKEAEQLRTELELKNEEIERLKKANESFSCIGKLYSEIKSEAIKEFAERFKASASVVSDKVTGFPCSYIISNYEFNNLLKEMECE